MQYNQLGKSTLEISTIGLGGMSLVPGKEKVNGNILAQIKDFGINYLDTSDLYDRGENEKGIGKLISGERQDWILATKVGNKWKEDGSGWDWAPSKAYILKAVEDSLKRLKTNYIDLYQLHGGTLEDPYDEIVEAFEQLVKEGKIRYYGISSIRPNVFLKYTEDSQIVSNMMQYSLLDRRPEEYLQQLKAKGVSVLARGSVAQGLLVDKPAMEYQEYSAGQVDTVQQHLADIAKKHGVSKLALAIKYPLLHDAVAASVVGIRTEDQAADLGKAIQDLDKISLDLYDPILKSLSAKKYTSHR